MKYQIKVILLTVALIAGVMSYPVISDLQGYGPAMQCEAIVRCKPAN